MRSGRAAKAARRPSASPSALADAQVLLDTVLTLTAIERKQELAQEIRERAEDIERVSTLLRALELQARHQRRSALSAVPCTALPMLRCERW